MESSSLPYLSLPPFDPPLGVTHPSLPYLHSTLPLGVTHPTFAGTPPLGFSRLTLSYLHAIPLGSLILTYFTSTRPFPQGLPTLPPLELPSPWSHPACPVFLTSIRPPRGVQLPCLVLPSRDLTHLTSAGALSPWSHPACPTFPYLHSTPPPGGSATLPYLISTRPLPLESLILPYLPSTRALRLGSPSLSYFTSPDP